MKLLIQCKWDKPNVFIKEKYRQSYSQLTEAVGSQVGHLRQIETILLGVLEAPERQSVESGSLSWFISVLILPKLAEHTGSENF